MSMDIIKQYEIAFSYDFYGPCMRLIRLAGLSEAEIVEAEAGLHIVPSAVRAAYLLLYVRGMSVFSLALKKHGPAPDDAAISAAMDELHRLIEHMRKGGL